MDSNKTINSSEHVSCGLWAHDRNTVSVIGMGISTLGLLCNLINIIVFSRPTLRKKPVNILLLALSVSDFLFPLFHLMWCIQIYIFFKWEYLFSEIWLITAYFAADFLELVSLWFAVAVSIFRYIAVCFPLKAKYMCTPTRAKLSLLFTTLPLTVLYLAVGAITFLTFEQIEPVWQFMRVFAAPTSQSILFFLWNVTIFKVVPCTFILSTSIHMVLVLLQSKVKRKTFTAAEMEHSDELIAIVMLLIIVTLYPFCHIPVIVEHLVEYKSCSHDIFVLYATYRRASPSFCMVLLNSCINLFLYCSMCRQFRATLNAMLITRHAKQTETSVASRPTVSTRETV